MPTGTSTFWQRSLHEHVMSSVSRLPRSRAMATDASRRPLASKSSFDPAAGAPHPAHAYSPARTIGSREGLNGESMSRVHWTSSCMHGRIRLHFRAKWCYSDMTISRPSSPSRRTSRLAKAPRVCGTGYLVSAGGAHHDTGELKPRPARSRDGRARRRAIT